MLSSPVYTKSHPRRDASRGHSLKSFQPFNSFPSNSFRTLQRDRRPQSFCFQMLADSFHRHGGVYPPRTERLPRMGLSQTGDSTQLRGLVVFPTFHESRGTNHEAAVAVPLRSNRNALISLRFLPLQTFSFTTRGYTPPVHEPWTKMKLEPASLITPNQQYRAWGTRLCVLSCRTLRSILPSQ
jgi:hypothetical protein